MFLKKLFVFFLSFYIFALINSVQACDADIKELISLSLSELMQVGVITVSKKDETIFSAPGIVSLISREEIQAFGSKHLYEILDRAASIYMTGSLIYPENNTSIRGDMFNGLDRHVLLLLNGRPFRESLNGGINIPIYNAVPVTAIDRLEIVRGPGSVLYGTNAYSGVINIITRNDSDFNNCLTGEISAGAGSFNSRLIDGFGSFTKDELYISAGFKYFEEDGWQFKAFDPSGNIKEFDMGSKSIGLTLNGSYRDFDFNLAWLDSNYATINSNQLWYLTPSTAKFNRFLGDIGHRFQLNQQQRLETHLTYNLAGFESEGTKFENFLLETTHYWDHEDWSWLTGMTAEYARDRQLTIDSVVPNYNETYYTIYSQLNASITPTTQFIIGGQGVKNPAQTWQFIPRLGLIHQFNKRLGTKLLYSEAYRAATIVERNINSPRVLGNPALTPETVRTFDAQLYYQYDKQQLSLTLFHSQQEDLIVRYPVPEQRQQGHFNEGKLVLRGIELEGKFTLDKNWFFTISLTYQENQHNNTTDDYTLAPNWLFKTGISYQFDSGIQIGLFNNYVGKMPDVIIRNPDRQLLNPIPDNYNLMTLNVNFPLIKLLNLSKREELQLSMYLYNVLNEDIYGPEINFNQINSVPIQAGRSGYTYLEYRF